MCIVYVYLYVAPPLPLPPTITVDLKSWKQIWFNKKRRFTFIWFLHSWLSRFRPPPIVGVCGFYGLFLSETIILCFHIHPSCFIYMHTFIHTRTCTYVHTGIYAHWDCEWQRQKYLCVYSSWMNVNQKVHTAGVYTIIWLDLGGISSYENLRIPIKWERKKPS